MVAPRSGHAVPSEVGGGGPKTTDCLTTFIAEVNTPAANPRHVTCTDGDMACDTDMAVNGVCNIDVKVCANSTFSTCTLNGVETITVQHSFDDGMDPKFDTSFQALQNRVDNDLDLTDLAGDQMSNQCTGAASIAVPIKGPLGSNHACHPNTKKVKLFTDSKPISGRVYHDTDVIRLKCLPSPTVRINDVPNTCDATMIFTGGTFERIQRQIFNQNCAVATCHDSQSKMGDLLLETGASFTNLVNVPANNPAANGAMWNRITSVQDTSGDLATSYIYHKITGDLPDSSYGVRMPFHRAKLNATYIDIIRLWIEAGTPMTGWVPGTD